MKTKKRLLFWILVLLMASFACGKVQVGIVSPTPESDSLVVVETQQPKEQISVPIEADSQPIVEPDPEMTVEASASDSTQRQVISATAWLGHIVTLPEGGMYDDFILLSPAGVGEFGVTGTTPEIESEIHFLRDAEGTDEYVYFWGQYSCGVMDYGQCQLLVDHIQRAG